MYVNIQVVLALIFQLQESPTVFPSLLVAIFFLVQLALPRLQGRIPLRGVGIETILRALSCTAGIGCVLYLMSGMHCPTRLLESAAGTRWYLIVLGVWVALCLDIVWPEHPRPFPRGEHIVAQSPLAMICPLMAICSGLCLLGRLYFAEVAMAQGNCLPTPTQTVAYTERRHTVYITQDQKSRILLLEQWGVYTFPVALVFGVLIDLKRKDKYP